MNGNARKSYSFVVAVLVVPTVLPLSACICRDEEDFYIGEVGSKEEGLRASIQILAARIQKCQTTQLFRVWWDDTADSMSRTGRHALLYDRSHKIIGYEDDLLSGISDRPRYADDAAIRTVSENGGGLEDFSLYERRPR